MKPMRSNKFLGAALAGSAVALTASKAMAQYVASEAATAAGTAMTQIKDDVSNTLGPGLIGVVIAVSLVMLAVSFLRKSRN